MAAAGAGIGIAVAAGVARLSMHAIRAEAAPAAWIWMAGPAMLGLAMLIAGVVPARRASLTDPVRALRDAN
jgi:ABC-type lipoprotein release transport system permease subunit